MYRRPWGCCQLAPIGNIFPSGAPAFHAPDCEGVVDRDEPLRQTLTLGEAGTLEAAAARDPGAGGRSQVTERFVHSHISFHTRGHRADGILENDPRPNSKQKQCLEWLLLLEQLQRDGGFARFVLLELECAKSRAQVQNSLAVLKSWLNAVCSVVA